MSDGCKHCGISQEQIKRGNCGHPSHGCPRWQEEQKDLDPFPVGTPVEKTSGEYDFPGTVVASFLKLGGQRRYVVEDDRRSLHIFSAANLRVRKVEM